MTWTRGPTIGRGSSAVVSLATTSATGGGDLFAVKSSDFSSSTFLQKEEELISQLSSPYIVKCFGSDITRENNRRVYNLFLEYIPGGTLSDQIKRQGGSLGENAIQAHAYQILLGINYLHRKGLAHCDIKGQNILIGDDGLKIADFGCAKWVESGEPAAFSGTPAYMAPEVARGEEQSFQADVWAFGCTIIEMATGSGPWPEMKDPAAALYRIAFAGDIPETPSWLSDTAKDMLTKCLMRDQRERWTAAQLLHHPFFDSVEEEEISCGDIGESRRKSPTSVMDQGIWDALEESDCSRNPSEVASSSDSPSGRVGTLIGQTFPANLSFPGWADEEGWLTVRGDQIEERLDVQDYEDLSDAEIATFSSGVVIVEEEEEGTQIQSSNSVEDSVIHSNFFHGNSGSHSSRSTFPVTHSDSVNGFPVFKIANFENYIISSSRLTFYLSLLEFSFISWYHSCRSI
ncbi:hypothetical protein OROMI_023354 [Orobanche minor]